MNYNIYNQQSGTDLGNFESNTAYGAILEMMRSADETVFTINDATSDNADRAFDCFTWDSEEDARNDDGQRAKTRATLHVKQVI